MLTQKRRNRTKQGNNFPYGHPERTAPLDVWSMLGHVRAPSRVGRRVRHRRVSAGRLRETNVRLAAVRGSGGVTVSVSGAPGLCCEDPSKVARDRVEDRQTRVGAHLPKLAGNTIQQHQCGCRALDLGNALDQRLRVVVLA